MEAGAGVIRIDVSSAGGPLDGQTRAYAEYRLFSRLAPARAAVDYATIALVDPPPAGGDTSQPARDVAPRAICTISITLHHGKRVRVSARAPHIYDAIDRAVDGAARGVLAS